MFNGEQGERGSEEREARLEKESRQTLSRWYFINGFWRLECFKGVKGGLVYYECTRKE